jgi:hypothetical protein
MNVLLSTAYWPNAHYFFYVLHAETVFIEQFENYQKQSFRNRTQILSANGTLDLSVPIVKNAPKELVKNLQICYKENWQSRHWRAITSAYKNSPYFEYFETDVAAFYLSPFELLLDYNLKQLQLILKILKLKKEIRLTSEYIHDPTNVLDLRQAIHPKHDFRKDKMAMDILSKPYYQTFENKFDFIPNLSMLDLLFNKGLEALDHLGN